MKFTTTLAVNGKSILRTMTNDPHCFSLKYDDWTPTEVQTKAFLMK